MKIPVMDKNSEIDGADVSGGDLTPAQDAGDAMEEVNDVRRKEQEVQQQQVAGEVDTQTKEHNPRQSPDDAKAAMQAPPTGADQSDLEMQLKHLAADFENYKRQATRRVDEERARAVQNTISQLLPVLDNFNLALQHAGTAKDVESLKVGLEFIAQQLENTLRGLGVEPIEAKGQHFDPLRHEAIEQVSVEGAEPGTVVEEAQRGYIYKGQVLRTSRVKVAS